ncbi:hypothetical protein D3C71_1882750 [compost metagenome]
MFVWMSVCGIIMTVYCLSIAIHPFYNEYVNGVIIKWLIHKKGADENEVGN